MIKTYFSSLLLFILLVVFSLDMKAYNDPYGFCADLTNYETQLLRQYDLSPYIQGQIHKIIEDFIKDCDRDNPGEIAGELFRNVAISRMKDMAEKFHRDKRLDLLSNLQSAQWVDLGYPKEKGTPRNYMLRTDLGFNNHFDCIVIHEVNPNLGAIAHDPLRVIEGAKYIIEEYSFYDNFSQLGEGQKYYVSQDGSILYVEKLYDEDYLFNASQFDSATPYYSILIKTIKALNNIE